MRSFKVVILFAVLFAFQPCAFGVDFDLLTDSPYCKASDAKYPRLRDLVIPDWKKESRAPLTYQEFHEIQATNPRLRQALMGPLADLNELSHLLNDNYLSNIRESLYNRLRSAADAGVDIRKYRPALDAMAFRCSRADISMQGYKMGSLPLQGMVNEVLNDFRFLKISPSSSEIYMRKLAVAALEAYRIGAVMKFLGGRLKEARSQEARDLINASLDEHERRLIRLRFAFPALGDIPTSHIGLVVSEDLVTNHLGIRELKALFWSHPQLETILGVKPPGGVEPVLKPVPFAPAPDGSLSNYYPELYQRVLTGSEILYPYVRRELANAIDESVAIAIESASLKCANPSPCSAFAVDPELTALAITKLRRENVFGPLVCACRIGESHETVPANINLGLGLVAAGSVIAALLQPEVSPLVYTAWGFSLADMGAAAAGIYDGVDSYYRTKKRIAARSGGSTDDKVFEESMAEMTQSEFELGYDAVTGVVGLAPPAKMTMTYARVPWRAAVREFDFLKKSSLEIGKGLTGIAAPDVTSKNYSENWDPRRLFVPLPPAMAERYPVLWRHLQEVAGRGAYASDPRRRDNLLSDLKRAIETMVVSGNVDDLNRLQHGEIRANLCLLPESRSFDFVK